MAPCGPGAVRMEGGYAALADALAKTLPSDAVRLGAPARSITAADDGTVRVRHGGVGGDAADANGEGEMIAKRVVVAVPPRVAAATISFSPELPDDQAARMRGTATWAGDWCKVVASFKSNFWRASVPRDSGVSQPGRGDGALLAVTWEAADSNDLGEGGDCLAGVNFGRAACARLDAFGPHADPRTGRSGPELRAAVARELGAVFGEEVIEEQLLEVYHQAWIGEAHTWRDGDEGKLARGDDPRRLYGHEALRRPTAWGVHFAGTETEAKSGHVDGAVLAGNVSRVKFSNVWGNSRKTNSDADGGGRARGGAAGGDHARGRRDSRDEHTLRDYITTSTRSEARTRKLVNGTRDLSTRDHLSSLLGTGTPASRIAATSVSTRDSAALARAIASCFSTIVSRSFSRNVSNAASLVSARDPGPGPGPAAPPAPVARANCSMMFACCGVAVLPGGRRATAPVRPTAPDASAFASASIAALSASSRATTRSSSLAVSASAFDAIGPGARVGTSRCVRSRRLSSMTRISGQGVSPEIQDATRDGWASGAPKNTTSPLERRSICHSEDASKSEDGSGSSALSAFSRGTPASWSRLGNREGGNGARGAAAARLSDAPAAAAAAAARLAAAAAACRLVVRFESTEPEMSRGRRERRRRRVLLGTLVGTSVSTLVDTLVGVHARVLVRGLGGFRGGFARRATRLPRASNLPPASLAVEHELRAGRGGGERARGGDVARGCGDVSVRARVPSRARGRAGLEGESRVRHGAPDGSVHAPSGGCRARVVSAVDLAGIFHGGGVEADASRDDGVERVALAGTREAVLARRAAHGGVDARDAALALVGAGGVREDGGDVRGAAGEPAGTSPEAPAGVGGRGGGRGASGRALDGRADAPAPATDVVGVAARVMLMLAGRLKRDALRGTGEERRERGAVHSRGIHRVRLALGGRGHREEGDARGDMRARTNARPRCRRLSVGVSTRERRGRSRASEASADITFSWRGQRASKESFSGVVEGENVSRGASRVRRSRGGNLTTRDRALRVPYPSRLLLACARGDATQRLAAPGGSRWTRRERLDVPSSARSGCFGSRSLGSRLCDARAGFLPHTPPTLTQPRVAHPDGSVPFPVYRLES